MDQTHNMLLVVHYKKHYFSCPFSMSTTLSEVTKGLCDEFAELRGLVFELSYNRLGKRIVIDDDVEVEYMASYNLAKKIELVEVDVSIVQPTVVNRIELVEGSSSIVDVDDGTSSNDEPLRPPPVGWIDLFTGVGQVFSHGAEEFRINLHKYSCMSGYKWCYLKNDNLRITVECKEKKAGCKWYIHARNFSAEKKFKIKNAELNHTCFGPQIDPANVGLSKKLVKSLSVSVVRDNPLVKPKEIMDMVKRVYGIECNYRMAYDSKEASLFQIQGDEESSYNHLIAYKEELLASNPGSIVNLELFEDTRKFNRIFIAFKACIDGFQFCRPIIFLDGTSVKTKFSGCLLAANTRNGNQGFYTIAIAVVDIENDSNWFWFLENLKVAIGNGKRWTFVSDRQKSLVSSIQTCFPNSYHCFCLQHLKFNINSSVNDVSNTKKQLIVKKFLEMAKAPTHVDFSQCLEDFKGFQCVKANKWLSRLPFVHFANAYFQGQRFGDMYSNIAESFNNWIRGARNLPITSMLDLIRMEMMRMISESSDKAKAWDSFLCPYYKTLVDDRIEKARPWKTIKSSDTVYEVCAEQNYMVDLSERRCTCNYWKIEGFPCIHAILAIHHAKMEVNDFVDPYFHASTFRTTYSFNITPALGYAKPDSVADELDILPPNIKKVIGRRKRIRVPNIGSVPKKPKKTVKCSKCGQVGTHDSTTCLQ